MISVFDVRFNLLSYIANLHPMTDFIDKKKKKIQNPYTLQKPDFLLHHPWNGMQFIKYLLKV